MARFSEHFSLAAILGALFLSVAASNYWSVRLAVFALILAVLALAFKIDSRRLK